MNAIAVVVVVMFMAAAPEAIGANCFANSPGKNRGNPPTTEKEIQDLSHSEYEDLSRILDLMKGFWNGVVTEINCKGDLTAIIEEKQQYTVRARVTKNYMPVEDTLALRFRSTWEGSTRNVSKPQDFRLLLTKQRLRLDRNNPAGDVETIKVSPGFLVFMKKASVRNPSGGVVSQEIVRSILLDYKSMKMEYLSFSNGRLVSKSHWELNR